MMFKLSFFPDVTVVVQYTSYSYRRSPVLGLSYTLTCHVSVADYLCPYNITTSIYQWTKSNSTVTELQVETESNTLSFDSLKMSDAGQYTCHATVNSFHNIRVVGSYDLRISSKLAEFSLSRFRGIVY